MPYVQTRDSNDALHVASCINTATGLITLLNGVPVPAPSGPVSGQPRFDLNFTPAILTPSMGGPKGAGAAALDPFSGIAAHRLTDWLFAAPRAASCGTFDNCSQLVAGLGGSAERQAVSYDDKRLILEDGGGDGVPTVFDPNSLTLTPIPPSGQTFATELPNGGCQFTRNADYKCYTINYSGGGSSGDPELAYYDLSSATTVPAATVVYDIGGDSNCYPSGYPINSTNSVPLSVSADGSVFLVSPGNAGQGSGYIVIAIKPSLGQGDGCRYYQTGKPSGGVGTIGKVAGSWGSTGTSSDTDNYTVHHLEITQGANPAYVRIDYQNCLTVTSTCPASGDGAVAWNIGALTATGVAEGGHMAMGQLHNIDSPATCSPTCQTFFEQAFTSFGTLTQITNANYTTPNHVNWDFHISYLDANASDSNPWCGATFVTNSGVQTTPGVLNYPWDGEVFCGLMDGSGMTARYAQTHCVHDTLAYFNGYDCIGTMSPDGKSYFWTSAWDNTLGTKVQDVSSWSRSTNLVTVTNKTACPFAVGDSVIVNNAATGGGGTQINGTWTLTAVSGATFSFAQTAANDSSATAQGADLDTRCTSACRVEVFSSMGGSKTVGEIARALGDPSIPGRRQLRM